jgi:hypothetical protein
MFFFFSELRAARSVVALVALAILLLAPSFVKAQTLQQQLVKNAVNSNAQAITVSGTGHALVLITSICNGDNGTTLTVTDNSGSNTWTNLTPGGTCLDHSAGAVVGLKVFIAPNVASGTYTVTAADSSGTLIQFNLSDWTGLATSSLSDVVGACAPQPGSGSPLDTGTLTTSLNTDLIIGAVAEKATSVLGAITCGPTTCTGTPTSFTAMTKQYFGGASGQCGVSPGYAVSTAHGLWQGQATDSAPAQSTGLLVALKPLPPPTIAVSGSFGNGGSLSVGRAVTIARADSLGNGGGLTGSSAEKVARAGSFGNGGALSTVRAVNVAVAGAFGHGGSIAAARSVVNWISATLHGIGGTVSATVSTIFIPREPPVVFVAPMTPSLSLTAPLN